MASALDGLRAEAEGTSLSVGKWKTTAPTFDIIEAQALGHLVGACRLVLGDQWDKFKKNKKKAQLEAFLEDYYQAYGSSTDLLMPLVSVMHDDAYCRLFELDCLAKGVELRGIFSGVLSVRRLAIIYANLEDGSHLMRHLGGKSTEWDRKEYMLADIADMLNYQTILIHILAQINGLSKPVKPPKPVYIRPAEVEQKKVFNTSEDLAALLRIANG